MSRLYALSGNDSRSSGSPDARSDHDPLAAWSRISLRETYGLSAAASKGGGVGITIHLAPTGGAS